MDRVPNFHIQLKVLVVAKLQIWELLSLLDNPLTILVTDFTNPDNLTYYLLILNSLIINKSLVSR